MIREVGKAIEAAADFLSTEASVSITSGGRSGKIVKGVLRKRYQASAPGEPPAYDTEYLHNSIRTERTGPLTAVSAANDPKAAPLEFGTSKMAARPFMQPAA